MSTSDATFTQAEAHRRTRLMREVESMFNKTSQGLRIPGLDASLAGTVSYGYESYALFITVSGRDADRVPPWSRSPLTDGCALPSSAVEFLNAKARDVPHLLQQCSWPDSASVVVYFDSADRIAREGGFHYFNA